MKQEPIALRDNSGTIRAWACPRCYRVSMSVSCGGKNARAQEAEHSKTRAEECGVCCDCGTVTDCNRYRMRCAGCQAISDERADVYREQHRAEWEQQMAEHRVARAAFLERLLADLPALRARDWEDDEDLAAELMPLILQRL